MEDFSVLQKRIIKKAALISLFLLVEAILYQEKLVALGFLIGSLVSVINFLHLSHTFKKVTNQEVEQKKVKPFVFNKYSVRLILIIGVLALSWKGGTRLFIATLIGLMVVKVAILLDVLQNAVQSYLRNYLSRIKRR